MIGRLKSENGLVNNNVKKLCFSIREKCLKCFLLIQTAINRPLSLYISTLPSYFVPPPIFPLFSPSLLFYLLKWRLPSCFLSLASLVCFLCFLITFFLCQTLHSIPPSFSSPSVPAWAKLAAPGHRCKAKEERDREGIDIRCFVIWEGQGGLFLSFDLRQRPWLRKWHQAKNITQQFGQIHVSPA